jgi:hypothetical protein
VSLDANILDTGKKPMNDTVVLQKQAKAELDPD